MSASLVGSEMCIRDRPEPRVLFNQAAHHAVECRKRVESVTKDIADIEEKLAKAKQKLQAANQEVEMAEKLKLQYHEELVKHDQALQAGTSGPVVTVQKAMDNLAGGMETRKEEIAKKAKEEFDKSQGEGVQKEPYL
eukprot:13721453-Alexandrium_andersonii.AAC.1